MKNKEMGLLKDKIIYIAGPLFNEMERNRNIQIKNVLEKNGFLTYLPQKDAGVSYDLIAKGIPKEEVRRDLFRKDFEAIKKCYVILCILDGRVPDEGMCIELGIAYALGKFCIGYKTDVRAMDKYGDNNIMIDGCLMNICTSEESLIKALHNISDLP